MRKDKEMSETKFYREDHVKEKINEAEKELGDKWGNLWDGLAESCKDTLSELRLMLVYLFKDLGDKPEEIEEKYIKNLKDETAVETARLALKISQGEI